MLIRMRMMRRLLMFAGLGIVLVACSLGSIATSPEPAATPTCWRSPLTDACGDETQPVIVAKIDDVNEARPQFNLNSADLVIVEPVEGGLTRLFAVYQSQSPTYIGPIRSARITDTDLVPAFGTPGFAYSGSASRLVPYLLDAQLQLIGAPQGGDGYFRIDDRPAPHNYLAELSVLRTRIDDPAAAAVTNIRGWKIDKRGTETGTTVTEVAVRWPAAKKTYYWNGKWWNMSSNGQPLLTQLDLQGATESTTARNIVIMESALLPSPFSDKYGARTPYVQTEGTGNGYVLTRGRLIPATWQRATKADLPRWFTSTGDEITLTRGRTWWLIVSDLDGVTYR